MMASFSDPIQIRLSGSGGQGLMTAGIILAEAALLDEQNVVQTQTYGPEARLGSSKAEVIISKREIAYPQVTVPDILMALSTQAAMKYLPCTHGGTLVILDATNVALDDVGLKATDGRRIVHLPITAAAIEVGSKVVANTVALGVLNALTSVVSGESLLRAVSESVPSRFRELNEEALRKGAALARSIESVEVESGLGGSAAS